VVVGTAVVFVFVVDVVASLVALAVVTVVVVGDAVR